LVSDAPLILAFDTSAAQCAAALLRGPETVARAAETMTRGQAERLFPMLEELLLEAGSGWVELDALAVCTGPGNFTGIRLGVAAARGLSMALGIPAMGVSLFEALAEGRSGAVLTLADNRRGGASGQMFRDGAPVAPPVGALEDLGDLPPGTICVGFAAAETGAALGLEAGDPTPLVTPEAIARAGLVRRGTTAGPPVPLYLRAADAAPPSELAPVLLDDA
jgi:tRNA threonylcarbamoyl adenosine modification protein YeaZ